MDWYQNKRRITITAVGKRAAVANTRFCFGKDHIPVMKERYYRIERKRRQAKNTRLLLLGGIAAVVCVGVLAAAIVMYSTVGQKAPDGGLVGKTLLPGRELRYLLSRHHPTHRCPLNIRRLLSRRYLLQRRLHPLHQIPR